MDIGGILKEAREEKGISLDKLQETTKIQKRYLVAIEEGNFGLLPGKFYAKAFIKEYANAVGIDSEELISSYERTSSETVEEEVSEYTRVKQSPNEQVVSKTVGSLLPKITVIVLIIGIFLLAIYFYKKTIDKNSADQVENEGDTEIIRTPDNLNKEQPTKPVEDEDDSSESDNGKDKKEKPKKEKAEKEKSKKETDKETDDTAFEVVQEGTGSTPESIIRATNLGDEVQVTLESSGESWIAVKKADNSSVYQANLTEDQSPEELDLSGTDEINFVVGDARNLTIKINGKAIEYPVDPNQKVYQKLKIQVQ